MPQFRTVLPAKWQVAVEDPNLMTDDVIMCCVVRAVAEFGAVVEW